MRVGVVVQARVGASRFPNKVFHKLENDNYLLKNIIYKIRNETTLPLVLATTENKNDAPIVEWCRQNKIDFFVGDENNVLKRFYDVNLKYDFDYVIRVCADNFFLSTEFINDILDECQKGLYDYISFYTKQDTPCIKTHYGFFCEGISKQALQMAFEKVNTKLYQEHVTPFFYENEGIFNIKKIKLPEYLEEKNQIRCTFDDEVDTEIINYIIKAIGVNALPSQIATLVEEEKDLRELMAKQILKYNK